MNRSLHLTALGTLLLCSCHFATRARVAPPAVDTQSDPHHLTFDLARAEREATSDTLHLPFAARSDEALTSATLTLGFGHRAPNVSALDVTVNGELVRRFAAGELVDGHTEQLRIAPSLLGGRNTLLLRLETDSTDACSRPGAEAWAVLRDARLALEAAPLPLPNDLALLPLPFVDRGFDHDATIAVVLPRAPTPETVKLAGLVAGWFGLRTGVPLRFRITTAMLPSSSAVVLVDDPATAKRLGVPAPDAPEIRLVDHPAFPGSNVKLLVIEGPGENGLDVAVKAFASDRLLLAGAERRVDAVPRATADASRSPRWVPVDRVVPIGRYPDVGPLEVRGLAGGAVRVKFRIPPDVWGWPDDLVPLDLGWFEELPEGAPAPRLDVELNGRFIGTLPPLDRARGETVGRTTLQVPAGTLRGFDELVVHVGRSAPLPCDAGATTSNARVGITPDSVLHLEKLARFATLPDVARFAHDGFPFTSRADLDETAVVLPERPRTTELEALLSYFARFASITGRVATGVQLVGDEDASAALDSNRDLLLVGVPADNALLRAWASRLPVSLASDRVLARMPSQDDAWLSLLEGRRRADEAARANRVLSSLEAPGLVAGFESPLRAGRSVVAVTATSAAALPSAGELTGYAQSHQRAGDLLVVAGARRWMFRVGPSYDVGRLPPWTLSRLFLATHWLLLFPALILGAAILGVGARRRLLARVATRLGREDARP